MSVIFTAVTIKGNRNLQPDEHGYYPMVFGKFNAFNRSGIFYKFTDHLKNIFTSSSSFMRAIQEGKLRGELAHPRMEPGMEMADYLNRLRRIEEKNVCMHIRDIKLHDPAKDGSILVSGHIRPSGPYADVVDRDLKDPYTNFAVSLRSIVTQRMVNGILTREIKQMITYDAVGVNGVVGADKTGTMQYGIEDADDLEISDEKIPYVIEDLNKQILTMKDAGLEDDAKSLKELTVTLADCVDGSCYLNDW